MIAAAETTHTSLTEPVSYDFLKAGMLKYMPLEGRMFRDSKSSEKGSTKSAILSDLLRQIHVPPTDMLHAMRRTIDEYYLGFVEASADELNCTGPRLCLYHVLFALCDHLKVTDPDLVSYMETVSKMRSAAPAAGPDSSGRIAADGAPDSGSRRKSSPCIPRAVQPTS